MLLLRPRIKYKPIALCCLLLGFCLSILYFTHKPDLPTYFQEIPLAKYSYKGQTQFLPEDDYTRLINLKNFKFTKLNNACNITYPLLLVLIHSHPKNYEKRIVIRETWGHHIDKVVCLFVLGDMPANDTTLRSDVEEEIATFGDFIQGNFLDTYRNMTYKHAMDFKYTIYHCPSASYLLKTDDDVFVNLPQLMDFLDNDLKSNQTKDLMFCVVQRTPVVMRSYRAKWRVSYKTYPDSYYPDMCPGWTILYSSATLFKLYSELQQSPYFWIDDVLITGVLRQKLDIGLTNAKQYKVIFQNFSENGTLLLPVQKVFFFGHANMSKNRIYSLWDYVKDKIQSEKFHYDSDNYTIAVTTTQSV